VGARQGHRGFSRYREEFMGVSDHDALNGIDTRYEQTRFNIVVELVK
jgi:hypothetical protein